MIEQTDEPALTRKDLERDGRAVVAMIGTRPIAYADLAREAASEGREPPGADSPAFDAAVKARAEQALLAEEARRRGIHRDPDVRLQLLDAEERLLGAALLGRIVDEQVGEDAIQALFTRQAGIAQAGQTVTAWVAEADSREAAEAAADALERGVRQGFERRLLEADGDSPRWSAVLADTPRGEVSAPFEADGRWHVLLPVSRSGEPPQTLEEARPELAAFLTRQALGRLVAELSRDSRPVMLPGSQAAVREARARSEAAAEAQAAARREAAPFGSEAGLLFDPAATRAGADEAAPGEDGVLDAPGR